MDFNELSELLEKSKVITKDTIDVLFIHIDNKENIDKCVEIDTKQLYTLGIPAHYYANMTELLELRENYPGKRIGILWSHGKFSINTDKQLTIPTP